MRVSTIVPGIVFAALAVQASAAASHGPKPNLPPKQEEAKALLACSQSVIDDLKRLKIPEDRALRFQGNVSAAITGARAI